MFRHYRVILRELVINSLYENLHKTYVKHLNFKLYEGWNFNSGNYLFTTEQNGYMFRSFTVLHCSHQHCVQPVASDVEVVGYL